MPEVTQTGRCEYCGVDGAALERENAELREKALEDVVGLIENGRLAVLWPVTAKKRIRALKERKETPDSLDSGGRVQYGLDSKEAPDA